MLKFYSYFVIPTEVEESPPFEFVRNCKPEISPFRFAPVEMTSGCYFFCAIA